MTKFHYAPTPLIKLTRGFFTIVDAEDLSWIKKNRWCVRNPTLTPYACRGSKNQRGNNCFVHLHREVWERRSGRKIKDKYEIHHKNHNSLDNRFENLFECTRSVNNAMKQAARGNRKWKLPKGVFRSRSSINPYCSQIAIKGRHHYIGLFKNPQDAKKAFDAKWKEIYGDKLS